MATNDSPAILRRSTFTRWRKATIRVLALTVWGASVGGSLLFGAGGADAVVAGTPSMIGAGAALAVQLILSWLQLIHADRPRSPWYIGSVALSSAMTCLGYAPIYFRLIGTPADATVMVAWTVGGSLAALAADVWPERTLIGG